MGDLPQDNPVRNSALEPLAYEMRPDDDGRVRVSIAISLKRIADAICGARVMGPSPMDICACGHDRSEHPGDGPCAHGDYHQPTQCMSFRLCATSADIQAGWDEWSRECERRGV